MNALAAVSIADLESIRNLAESFDGAELNVDFSYDHVHDAHLRAVANLGTEFGLVYTVHAPFRDLNIGSLNYEIRDVSRRHLIRALEIADHVGARVLTIHPALHGYYPARFHNEMKARERDVIAELCVRASVAGVTVAYENLPAMTTHFPDSVDFSGHFRLLDEVDHPSLGICLDTGHTHQAECSPHDAVSLIAADGRRRTEGHRLRHIHVHDNTGGPVDEHLPVGGGTIDWYSFVVQLAELGFDGTVVFENMADEDKLTSLAAWNQYRAEHSKNVLRAP